jgi:alkanesulfonate monooxygenase SsuD/methylene tetrahydromethanopterin reductase-like flavin-dependent oxidoreductase (luciferase family)
MFVMRFDMRAPQPGVPAADLYAAAIDMCQWAETRDCLAVVLCEHHGASDGYLPSPLTLAAAVAARTERVAISVAATLLPFYDPVRLAEDMNVLDIISRGRVSYVFGLGYRPEEFEHFGVDIRQRGRVADEKLQLLLQLRAGEPVTHDGRRIHVTPPPFTPGGAPIMWGGGSIAAARRAARHGLGFLAQGSLPGMLDAYEDGCRALGREPGPVMIPDREAPSAIFVADDVDQAWGEIGSYLFHDASMYSAWNPTDQQTTSICHATSIDELRATSTGHRIMTPGEAAEHVATSGFLALAPLCGGLRPELAWPYLQRAVSLVQGLTSADGPAGPDGAESLLPIRK